MYNTVETLEPALTEKETGEVYVVVVL
jgi:hypothetical protein